MPMFRRHHAHGSGVAWKGVSAVLLRDLGDLRCAPRSNSLGCLNLTSFQQNLFGGFDGMGERKRFCPGLRFGRIWR